MPEQFRFSVATITSTNATTVLAPGTAATAMVRSLTLCNPHTANTSTADVTMYVASETASWQLFKYTQITAAQTLMPFDTPVVVAAGDSLQVSRDGADIDATATYLELS